MSAYYNELDPYAAQWLRNLITAGHIAPGYVDERSIVDVRPGDLDGYEQCHFFAGIGGWSHALRLADWPDDGPVWTGSCPCQPFSGAGQQKGFSDERHLWPAWVRLIEARKPSTIFGEQVASAVAWLRLVRGDLEALDYTVGAIPVEAASAGADHLRDRFWFVASDMGFADGPGWAPRQFATKAVGHWDTSFSTSGDLDISYVANGERDARSFPREETQERSQNGPFDGNRNLRSEHADKGDVSYAAGEQARSSGQSRECGGVEWVIGADGKARRVKSGIRLLAHDVPSRVAKLRAFGNAIVPTVAAVFIESFMQAQLEAA